MITPTLILPPKGGGNPRNWLDFLRYSKNIQRIPATVHDADDFDREEGNRYVRFSFSGSKEDMAEAMARLKGWLK